MGMHGRVCETCNAELQREEEKAYESYMEEAYERGCRATAKYKEYMDAVYREEMEAKYVIASYA